ncbi:MAG TPA: FtsH protease activity modulator HflK [Bacteroidetes bacterium]|nr:modulator of FtsH protease HflK [bacterium BMS3Bbin04]HDO65037.1 FtsH protease activity modulator HflK [Bacteroidota bacterium]HEX04162.1 FtsH protease activity modulator HflK [Bacteroidota bacterium]
MNIPFKHYQIGDEVVRLPDFGKLFGKSGIGLVVVIVIIWLATGFHVVGPDEAGVIRTFGEFTRLESSGLNYNIPWPIETVVKPKVTEVKRIEVGFRDDQRRGQTIDVPKESLMLSGNLNIIDIDLIVQYKINDPVKYLFVVRDVEETIHVATEAVIRQVVGQHSIDEALTSGKGEIQTEAMIHLQEILDSYETGVSVTQLQLKDVLPPQQVANAFREVASAKEDKSRLINEAQGYANNLIPRARGEAEQMILEAEGYAAERVKQSEGDAENFKTVLAAYKRSPAVTRKRMLLETMEAVLPGINKYIVQTPNGGDLINLIGPQVPSQTGVTSPNPQGGTGGGR